VSIIIPFEPRGGVREENYRWLLKFYSRHLPCAQIVTSGWPDQPFNKSAAINQGFAMSTGDVIVILDADALMNPDDLLDAVAEVRLARDEGRHLWVMPYRRLYRLVEWRCRYILDYFDPKHIAWRDLDLGDRPLYFEYDNHEYISHGHPFGAMVQVVPCEAFLAVGGWDVRFAGWGGEDVSQARALDTLYGHHRALDHPVYHLWHPSLPPVPGQGERSRSWEGQNSHNGHLAQRYGDAYMDHDRMKRLTQEWMQKDCEG
jgi:Glycosyl transferase family 2